MKTPVLEGYSVNPLESLSFLIGLIWKDLNRLAVSAEKCNN